MSDRFDLVIIGAGFAGLTCAHAAAAHGLRVAVVERKPEPGVRMHTTGIVVKEASEEIALPGELVRRVAGVRLYSPRLKSIDFDSPGYYFLATDTPALMRWLARRAEQAGARLIFGETFEGARRDGDGFVLDRPALTARYLVGADGARSRVAERFGLGRNRRMLIGMEVELEGVGGLDSNRLHCFLDSNLAPGYIGWAVPGIGITQIGVASHRGKKPVLSKLVEKLSGTFDFSRARVVGRRSGPIPVGGPVRPLAAHGVLLVGDAAGMVSPLTAGGIHTALRYGRLAGESIAEYLRGDGADPGAVLAAAHPGWRWKKWLRRGIDLGPPNWLYDLTLGLPPARALAQLVFFHSKGLKSPAAWRDLFGRGG